MNGIGKPFAPRCFDMAIVRAVMVFGCEKVPSFDRMIMPGSALVVLLMYLRRTPHRSKRHFIVVKRAAEMCICRDCGGSVRLLQEIERDLCLWEQIFPQIEGESSAIPARTLRK